MTHERTEVELQAELGEPAVVVYERGDGSIDIVLAEWLHDLPDGVRALRLAQLAAHFSAKAAEIADVDGGATRH